MPISDSSLQLLIGNYRAWEGKSMPAHYRDLLEALRELQERRAADKAQVADNEP